MMKERRQFGLWSSPITPASLAEGRRLDGVAWDSDGQTLVWLEGRSGRGVLVAATGDDAPRDLTADLSVRAEVGYGGGDFTVHGGWVYFVVHKTGRIYRQPLSGGGATAITPAFGQAAAPVVSPDGRWLAYVHHDDPHDRIAVVDAAGKGWPQILTAGRDFYLQPRWSADGKQFSWIGWDHPNMPWDGTRLYLADVIEGDGLPRLSNVRQIAGGDDVAIFQPEFTRDGRFLVYVSDETGWGRLAAQELATGQARWLTPEGVEFGMPAWVQDMRTYAICADGRTLVAAGNQNGRHRLQVLDIVETGKADAIDDLAGYGDVSSIAASPAGAKFAFIASGPKTPPRVVTHDLQTNQTHVLARSAGETVPAASLADCQAITWDTAGGSEAHGLLYRPASEEFEGTGRPPLIVLIHGGPTSQVRAGWRAEAQFFATRGYAVLLVNYRGSTGYGRDYMLRLRGNWGICDVEDAVSGMRHLADADEIDGQRTVIMGGSAGGFTVLQTMVVEPEAFTAGISLYGVANQFSLASDTHKFESRYLDSMLGPLPEAAAVYRERSPVFHAAKIRRPLAVFQGGIDTVVPKDQAESIVEALRRNGTPHIYHVYDDEGHGWRKRETIEHFYRAVEEFLKRHVIFA
ncbi:MAG TPA: prolyl oligopeptidase family serine peptidase [Pirellulales bacterium]|nr:prolyl oligopeptidase family serine peptidase [Pirellulales bacterium]